MSRETPAPASRITPAIQAFVDAYPTKANFPWSTHALRDLVSDIAAEPSSSVSVPRDIEEMSKSELVEFLEGVLNAAAQQHPTSPPPPQAWRQREKHVESESIQTIDDVKKLMRVSSDELVRYDLATLRSMAQVLEKQQGVRMGEGLGFSTTWRDLTEFRLRRLITLKLKQYDTDYSNEPRKGEKRRRDTGTERQVQDLQDACAANNIFDRQKIERLVKRFHGTDHSIDVNWTQHATKEDICRSLDLQGVELVDVARDLGTLLKKRVPIPFRDYPIDREKQQRWFQWEKRDWENGRLSDEKFEEVKRLFEDTMYIPWKEWFQGLQQCVEHFVTFIQNRKWVLLINPHVNKSNFWVFQLAARFIPLPILHNLQAVAESDLGATVDRKFNGLDGVIFDDASYSGEQLWTTIKATEGRYPISVVCPIMSTRSRSSLAQACRHRNINLTLHTSDTLKMPGNEQTKKHPVYLSFKVPDTYSAGKLSDADWIADCSRRRLVTGSCPLKVYSQNPEFVAKNRKWLPGALDVHATQTPEA